MTRLAPADEAWIIIKRHRGASEHTCTREFRFHHERRWRFDFAFPREGVAIEIDGGIWSRGRHVRGQGYENDQEKRNAATLMDWRVLNFTPKMVRNGALERALDELWPEA